MSRRSVALLLLLIPIVGAPAGGTEPPSSAPTPVAAFVHILDGKPIGEETIEATQPNGTAVHGHVAVTVPGGGSLTLDHASKLSEDRSRIVDYVLSIHATETEVTIHAVETPKGWRLEARQGSAEPSVVEKEITGPSVLMDNNMAWPIDLLARGLRLEVDQSTTYSTVVPQVMQVVPLKVTRLSDGKAKVDGAEVAVRHYRLEAASVLLEVTSRARDGSLLEAAVPAQRAAYRSKGYEPPARAAAAADPRESPAVVPSPAGDLPAVITRPRSETSVPGVVILSGSGPNDRDETIGPNKPLRDLALGLADHGIASLRFDKRTVVTKDPTLTSTLKDEYFVDALAAIRVLAATPGIDVGRLFVLGHSLGAAVAPELARQSGKMRGVVLLAPAVRRADDMVLDQIGLQLAAAGTDEAEIEAKRAELRRAFQAIRDGSPDAPANLFGAPPGYWRELFALDLAASLSDLGLPALVVQGEKDIQVRVDLDFDALRAKLGEQGGRIRYVRLPNLNHLFMKVEGPSTGAEYAIEGHVDPGVASAIAAWVKEVTEQSTAK